MVEVAGHTLNWIAAGVLFPLMMLPLARLLATSTGRALHTAIWWMICAAIFLAGVIFTDMVPRLNAGAAFTDMLAASLGFQGLVFTLAVIVFAAGGPARTGAIIARRLAAIVKFTGRAVMWLLLVMALVQFAVVLLRYVFGVNEIFMQESITYMHGAVFLLASGYALLTNDHVRVDIFYRDAPAKRKALVDLCGTYLFVFPICLVILWTSSPYVARSWAVLEGSADTSGIQGVFLLKSLIPAFAVLLAMAGFVNAHKAVETLKSGGD